MPTDYFDESTTDPSLLTAVDAREMLLNGQQETVVVPQGSRADAPVFTREQAKEVLLNTGPDINKIQAKQLLLGSLGGRQEAINQKVVEKQALLGRSGTIGPSLNGMPYAFLSESGKAAANELYAQGAKQEQIRIAEDAARKVRESSAFVSDAGLETIPGATINIAAGVQHKVNEIVGYVAGLPKRVMNFAERTTLDTQDFVDYDSVIRKEQTGEDLTPEEEALTKARVTKSHVGADKVQPTSKFDQIARIKEREYFLQGIDDLVAISKKGVNSKKTGIALDKVNESADKAVAEFKDGELVQGVGTFLGSIGTLAAEDTQAALELSAAALPEMYFLVKNTGTAITTIAFDQQAKAVEAFKEEYGREPDAVETGLTLAYSVAAASLDAVGAKVTLQTTSIIKDLTEKLGKDLPTEVVEKVATSITEKVVGVVGTTASKAIINPITKAVVVEGATEGAQNILTQQAGKQDLDKLDPSEVLADAAVGSVVGGVISTPVAAAAAISKTKEVGAKVKETTAAKVKEVVAAKSEAIKKAGVGKLDEVVEQATKDKKPEVAIQALQEVDLTTLDKDTRIDQLKELQKQISDYTTITENMEGGDEKATREEQIVDYKRVLTQRVKAHHKIQAGGASVKDSITILDQASKENSVPLTTEAVKVVSDAVVVGVTSGSATIQQVDKVLGSKYFGDMPTENQEIIRDYKLLQTTSAKLQDMVKTSVSEGKTAESVNLDVLNGGKGFVGIKQHIEAAQEAVALNNSTALSTTVEDIEAFKQIQLDKLNPEHPSSKYETPQGKIRPHSLQVRNFILEEVSVLNAALKHISNIASTNQVNVATPSPISEQQKPAKAVKPRAGDAADTEITTASPILVSDVVITPNLPVVVESLNKIQSGLGDSLTQVDSKIAGALKILEKCG